MARRGHGEGSVYQRKDGRWVASITLEHRKRKYFYGDTRKEVQGQLKVALHEQQQGMLATGPQQTMKVYLENWIEQAYKPTVKLNTYVQYRSIVHHHLVPAFGNIPVQKLTPEKLRAFYRQKLDEGSKPRTVLLIHTALRRALEDAVKQGLVPRNVAKLVSPPRIDRYEAQTLTVEQAEKLLGAARGSRLDALLILALTTGMRRGELLALRWDDVDFKQSLVFVHRTVTRVGGYGYVEGEPKTRSSRRRVVLPDVALEALKKHRIDQQQEQIKVGDKWQYKGLVFCDGYGGFFSPDMVLRKFSKLLRDIGLPRMRFHDLRHSAATILLVAGVHPKVVQERLGHSTVAMTLDVYSHVLPSMQQEVAGKIDDLFKHY
ncbi:MAG: tyrosine-type recombinase/integrase [Ktedonobacteraceae bacterium]